MTDGFEPWPTPAPEPKSRRKWITAGAVLAVVGIGAFLASYSVNSSRGSGTNDNDIALFSDSTARPPAGVRVTVRVVNGTDIRGLARRATLYLRDFGYDVVEYDSRREDPDDSTRIFMHTANTRWAEGLKRALGTGSIAADADSSHLVDLTVVLGRDWHAPANPLRP